MAVMTAKKILKQQQQDLLDELEKLAARKGLRISYGDMKFAGLRLKSGQCLFKGEPWVVLSRQDALEDKLALIGEALMRFDLSGEKLLADLVEILGLAAAPPNSTSL